MAPKPLLALLALLVALAGGCVVVETDEAEPAAEPEVEFDEEVTEEPDAPAEDEDLRVPLEIVEGPGGSTLAFVPVFIGDEGPFPFALDTGASNSVIDADLADELGLEDAGEPQDVRGVTGEGEAQPVLIDDWRVGDIDLGERVAASLPLDPGGDGQFVGLLGSDVLSEYGAVLVDYDAAELVLSPREQ
jgi:hypothetical protein